MPGETLNAPPPAASPAGGKRQRVLPQRLLYSIFARIGEHGLGTEASEKLLAAYRGGFLARAVGYGNRQTEIPPRLIQSLKLHPVRLLSSFVQRPDYYGAKKRYLDWITERQLRTRRYDFFHSWSGDCLQSLRTAGRLRIPSVLEIPTWHRDVGRMNKPPDEPPRSWRERLRLRRERFIEEYELADLILVFSEKAAESFRIHGFPDSKIHYMPNGVDTERFRPGIRPEKFRVLFSGALIKRKGIHLLLEAWHRLALKDAELWLIGSVHDEAKPYLQQFWRDDIQLLGFKRDVENYLREGTIYVFPSELEGNAKTVTEAAACGLPVITTRESGDVITDGNEGLIIPPDNVDAVAAAIQRLYNDRDEVGRMSVAARRRVEEHFTWEHCRQRLLDGYERAMLAAR
jgi:glycosyltransferase involved in cell wall biosynthesis